MANIKINVNVCQVCGHTQKNHASNSGCNVDGCNCDRIGTY